MEIGCHKVYYLDPGSFLGVELPDLVPDPFGEEAVVPLLVVPKHAGLSLPHPPLHIDDVANLILLRKRP